MNSSNAWDSLSSSEENESRKIIQDFIQYLQQWKGQTKNPSGRLAWQTELGLLVTLRGTIQLCDYLTSKLGYKYLMTRKLCQDPLEHFLGLVRGACGANTHPDPKQFIQVYRLLSTASLIKPPRGSNVTGGEMQSLTSYSDVMAQANEERKIKLEEEIDRILETGDEDAILQNLFLSPDEKYIEVIDKPQEEHCYNQNRHINPFGFQMFGGYVARKVRSMSSAKNCEARFKSLTLAPEETRIESQYLKEKRSRGFLLTPSTALYNFIYKVEDTILKVLVRTKLNKNILFEVVDELKEADLRSALGCKEHNKQLTKSALMFFLNTRMIFACKRFMVEESKIHKKRKQRKSLLKKFKLNAIPVNDSHQNSHMDVTIVETSQSTNDKKTKCLKNTKRTSTKNNMLPEPPIEQKFQTDQLEPSKKRTTKRKATNKQEEIAASKLLRVEKSDRTSSSCLLQNKKLPSEELEKEASKRPISPETKSNKKSKPDQPDKKSSEKAPKRRTKSETDATPQNEPSTHSTSTRPRRQTKKPSMKDYEFY